MNLKNLIPDIRHLDEMRKAVFDKEWLKTAGNPEIYYMYRSIEEKNGIRYDITVIPAACLGSEFAKTKGHYHVGLCQEIYTVLEGKAIYLMQKAQKETPEEIEDVFAVKAQKGDIVVIPSNYGHITINPSENEELKMANWISPQCKSDYFLFEKLGGACWYYTKDGWIKNENYKVVPDLRFKEPQRSLPKDLSFLKQI